MEGRFLPEEQQRLAAINDWVRGNLAHPQFVLEDSEFQEIEGVRQVWWKRAGTELLQRLDEIAAMVLEDSNFRGGPFVPCGKYLGAILDEVIYEDPYVVVTIVR